MGDQSRHDKEGMRIAIFSGEIPSSTFIESLIEGIAREHQVLLFGVINKKVTYANRNIHIIDTPFSPIKNLFFNIYRSIRLYFRSPQEFNALLNEIKKYDKGYDRRIWFTKFLPILLYKPDVLHLQWARDVEFYTFLKDYGIKVILSLRGAHINYTPVVDERAAREYKNRFPHIDAFHAVSQAIAKSAGNYNAPSRKISVIHSPVSNVALEKFNNTRKTRTEKVKMISIGRFHWIKGIRYALDACKILKEKGVDFHYTIVSTNAISEEALLQMHQMELADHVTVLYDLPQKELFELMTTFNMLILPSINEGIANVVLEAMALGLLVISTDCGGMGEAVIHKKTGWLVPVRDPEAIAEAVLEISALTEDERNEIASNAHSLVKQEFNYEDSIQKFISLYEDTLSINQ